MRTRMLGDVASVTKSRQKKIPSLKVSANLLVMKIPVLKLVHKGDLDVKESSKIEIGK